MNRLSHFTCVALTISIILFVTGCQSNPRRIAPYPGLQRTTRTPPPTRVRTPESAPAQVSSTKLKRVGYASFYGEELRGALMANGQPFDPDQLTAASWFFPFGTKVQVIHKNRSVVVEITDRGPALRLVRQGRTIDLSEAAFRQLADPKLGLIYVQLSRLSPQR